VTNVLVVEDDPRIARFVKRGLEAEGYGVEVAGNGEDAIELCRSNDYALVVLDRMLPDADGIEVCWSSCLRRRTRSRTSWTGCTPVPTTT
jgi:two-component system, OmpR family, response regulator